MRLVEAITLDIVVLPLRQDATFICPCRASWLRGFRIPRPGHGGSLYYRTLTSHFEARCCPCKGGVPKRWTQGPGGWARKGTTLQWATSMYRHIVQLACSVRRCTAVRLERQQTDLDPAPAIAVAGSSTRGVKIGASPTRRRMGLGLCALPLPAIGQSAVAWSQWSWSWCYGSLC